MTLPIWSRTRAARAILSELVADPPLLGPDSYRLPSIFGSHREPCKPRYRGKLAARLRKIHSEWLERELHLLDAQFKVTGVWDNDASRAIYATEDADAVIARMLAQDKMEDAA